MQAVTYVAVHKPGLFATTPGYQPIHVGRALATQDLGLPGDDTGDHISGLNPNFCELTLLYWMWKNATADVVGLAHYRRYFGPRERSVELGGHEIAAGDDFGEIGVTHDMIVGQPVRFALQPMGLPVSNEQIYAATSISLDLPVLREVVKERASDYLDYFDFVMRDSSCSICNMMIGRKAVVDDYAAWLFNLLFPLERRIRYQIYDDYQKRVFGFLSERLMTVWVAKNRTRYTIGYRPILQVE